MDIEFQERLNQIASNTSWNYIDASFVKESGTVQCPFCKRKGKGYLYPNYFKCFSSRCNKRGNKVNVYKELNQLSFWEAVKQLERSSGLDPKTQSKEFQRRNDLLSEVLYIYHCLLIEEEKYKPALNYLIDRGLTLEYIKQKQIGYAPACRSTLSEYKYIRENSLILQELTNNYGDFFHSRIIFPIYNQNGYLVHLTGRQFPDIETDWKYLDSKSVRTIGSSKQFLLFEEEIKHYLESSDTVYLTEGVMDTFVCNQLGINVLGLLGLQKIMSHVSKLSKFKKVVAIFDNDRYDLDHPYFPGELKSWRQVNPQLVDLQTYLGADTKIYTCMIPESSGCKDVNDYYKKYGLAKLKDMLNSNEISLTKSFIQNCRGDMSEHLTALKLVSTTGEGKELLRQYIAEDFDPLDYAIKVLNS